MLTKMHTWLSSLSGVSSLLLSGDKLCRLVARTSSSGEQSFQYQVGVDYSVQTGAIEEVMMFCGGTGTTYKYKQRGSEANNCNRCYVPLGDRCSAHCHLGECYYLGGNYVRCNSCRCRMSLHGIVLSLVVVASSWLAIPYGM
jgi:hypothetical protein